MAIEIKEMTERDRKDFAKLVKVRPWTVATMSDQDKVDLLVNAIMTETGRLSKVIIDAGEPRLLRHTYLSRRTVTVTECSTRVVTRRFLFWRYNRTIVDVNEVSYRVWKLLTDDKFYDIEIYVVPALSSLALSQDYGPRYLATADLLRGVTDMDDISPLSFGFLWRLLEQLRSL